MLIVDLAHAKKYGVRKDPVVLAKAIKDAVADLNELVAEAAKDELLVNYEIFPHKDTKTPHILVQVTQEVI